jgi:hypothetical protein
MTYRVETSAGGFYGPYDDQISASRKAEQLLRRGVVATVSYTGQRPSSTAGGKQPVGNAAPTTSSIQGGRHVRLQR